MAQKVWNHIYSGIMVTLAVLAAIPTDKLDIIPAQFKPYAAAVIGAALWFKGHRNLLADPPVDHP